MGSETLANEHPDRSDLDNWHLYGPKDSRIPELVQTLAFGHGMRLATVEDLIVQTLALKLKELDRHGR